MSKTNLTEEEKAKIIEALNSDTEPSPDLMEKLFPSVAEKSDVAKLDRAKVGTLEYAGKRSEAAIMNLASPTDAGSESREEAYRTSCEQPIRITREQFDTILKEDAWNL